MSGPRLGTVFGNLDNDIRNRLDIAKNSFAHPVIKGDASENVWRELLGRYLPRRYGVAGGQIVDSGGKFSDQIDVIVYDAQYSPPIFLNEGQTVIPAESVYAVFEVKQRLNAKHVKCARKKVASVRRLRRTSLPIPHAGGTFDKKEPVPVCGGLLALDGGWKRPLRDRLPTYLGGGGDFDSLDLGCAAARGYFEFDGASEKYAVYECEKPATAFLFALISRLQSIGTVPMIDMHAYAKWL